MPPQPFISQKRPLSPCTISLGHTSINSLSLVLVCIMNQLGGPPKPVSAPQSAPETRTASLDSSTDQIQDFQNSSLYLPRPAYQRPVSYGQRSPSNCTHCGNLTPRYGSTTVYGTPLGTTPATSTEKVNKYSYRHAKVCLLFCLTSLLSRIITIQYEFRFRLLTLVSGNKSERKI